MRGLAEPACGRCLVRDTGTRTLDVNAVVAHNIRTIRKRRGMTQRQVAARLAELTGHLLTQAAISALERGFDGGRRRRFDAHDLYLLSVVFDVPIAYFFLPPAGETRPLRDSRRPVHDLYPAVLGREHQLSEMDDRLAELDPQAVVEVTATVTETGPLATTWRADYRSWRDSRLSQMTKALDGFDDAVYVLADFFDQVRRRGLRAWVAKATGEETQSPPVAWSRTGTRRRRRERR